MYLLRRSAFKALSSSPIPSVSKPRSIASVVTRFTLRPSQQWVVSPLQRRFATDDAAPPGTQKTTDETVPEPRAQSEAETLAKSSATESGETPSGQAASATEATPETPAEQDSETAAKEAAAESQPSSSHAFVTPAFAPAASAATGAAATSSQTPQLRSRTMPGDPNPTLYVGNLYFEVNDQALRKHFEPFGQIKNTKIIYDHRGLSKGFGYVEFESIAEAAKAIEGLNQTGFQGRRMVVQFHRERDRSVLNRSRQPGEPTKTLFIGNMSYDMSDRDLNDLFREVKNVTDVRVAIDRRTGQPRGFAHADFIDVDSATKAMELLKTKEIYGRRLKVDYSKSSAMTRNVPARESQ